MKKKIIWLVCLFVWVGCAPQTLTQKDPKNWLKLVEEFNNIAQDVAFRAVRDEELYRLQKKFVALARRGHEKTFHFLFQFAPDSDAGWADLLGILYAELRDANPQLYEKVLNQESEEVRHAVEFSVAASYGIPGD